LHNNKLLGTIPQGRRGAFYSNANIIGCVIRGNTALEEGVGVDMLSGNANIVNCTLADNFAPGFGGSLCCQYGSDMDISNTILWANEANQGAQIALLADASTSVSYGNIERGQMAVHDPCHGLAWDGANVDADPSFAPFDPNGDPNVWDFYLQNAYGRWAPNSQSWVRDVRCPFPRLSCHPPLHHPSLYMVFLSKSFQT